MYIKLKDGQVDKYPYSTYELRKDNPDTSFPAEISDERLAEWDVYSVSVTPYPQVDYKQNVEEGTPELIDGVWTQVWNVTNKSQSEVDKITVELRAEAYRNESDPLFFKAQRGEATHEEWLDKVNEIKARYPKD
jgi:hypothetical protein